MSPVKFKKATLLFIILTLLSCSNLKKRTVARLDHSSSGCFHSETNRFTLYEKSGSKFAKLETNGKVVRDVKLSSEQLLTFNSFVKDLIKLKEIEGCTTVEEYALYSENRIIRKTDAGCNWDGFKNLERSVFNIMEK